MPFPSVRDVNPDAPKATAPMDNTLFGIVTDVSALPPKTPSAIEVTPDGTFTTPVHSLEPITTFSRIVKNPVVQATSPLPVLGEYRVPISVWHVFGSLSSSER
jgi:hypothetical protein